MDNLTPVTPVPPESAAAPLPPRDGWAVASGRGMEWWSYGWRLFRNSPLAWLGITVLYVVLMFVLALIPFLGQIASTLLYPVLNAGVLQGARAQDRGGQMTVPHLFSCFNEKAIPLIVVAVLYIAGWFVIWIVAAALLLGVLGFAGLASLMSALTSGDSADLAVAMLPMMTVGSLIVVLLAVLMAFPLVMAYWFAPALVLFRGDEPLSAMKTSFTACMRNMPPFLVYGLVGIVLAILATIPLGLGWIVLLPVYAASIYASYKDIFGEPA